MILFVNACVREQSRTKRLADSLLSILQGTAEEVRLREIVFPAVDEAFLKRRERLIGEGKFDDPLFRYARQFSEASQIVIAAPYWDLSFPAALKQYLEQVSVPGITFTYTQDGLPKGLCAAERTVVLCHDGGRTVRSGGIRIRVCGGALPGSLRDQAGGADPRRRSRSGRGRRGEHPPGKRPGDY